MSYIVAVHEISDPERFWAGARAAIPSIPPGVTLHATYPAEDGARAICLWEADSPDTVREIVDPAVGDAGRNDFFAVEAGHPFALGLPAHAAVR